MIVSRSRCPICPRHLGREPDLKCKRENRRNFAKHLIKLPDKVVLGISIGACNNLFVHLLSPYAEQQIQRNQLILLVFDLFVG